MRLASSLLISIAVHAVIISFPVSFLDTRGERIVIPVTLLGGSGNGSEGLAGKSGLESGRKRARPAARQPFTAVRALREHDSSNGSSREDSINGANEGRPINQESFATGPVAADFEGDSNGRGVSPAEPGGEGSGREAGGGGNSQTGGGTGGSGGGGGLFGSGFARVSYAYNPKPNYPEAARREGWEGTVILRVLVDREGRSRSIEIGLSSGFDTLDRAAMETVKSWRFHPAQYGQRRMESWVKIPIVFSLAE